MRNIDSFVSGVGMAEMVIPEEFRGIGIGVGITFS